MAKLIQAVAWLFGLRLVTRRTAQLDDVAPWFEGDSTALPESLVLSMLCTLQALTSCFNRSCSAVRLPRRGTFTPAVGPDGQYHVWLREALEQRNALSPDGAFRGEIANRAKMGTISLPPPR